jgi:hypothetical protein
VDRTRGHAAVFAHYAHERGRGGQVLRWLHVGTERVIAIETAHHEVVQVHMLSGRDVAAGKADDLVVAPHGFAGLDRARGDLVRRRHQAHDRDLLVEQRGAAHQLRAGDDDVVVRM